MTSIKKLFALLAAVIVPLIISSCDFSPLRQSQESQTQTSLPEARFNTSLGTTHVNTSSQKSSSSKSSQGTYSSSSQERLSSNNNSSQASFSNYSSEPSSSSYSSEPSSSNYSSGAPSSSSPSEGSSSNSSSEVSSSNTSSEEVHIHTYSNEWSFDENNHWHNATCEHTHLISDKGAHTFGAWVDSNEGKRSKTCSVCGYKVTEHVHVAGESVKEGGEDATCTTPGYYYLVTYCKICNEKMESQTVNVPAKGHSNTYKTEENLHNPTCVDNGYYDIVTYCGVCGEFVSSERFTIDATGHQNIDVKEENRVEPTCLLNGSYDSVAYCLDCGAELSREQVFLGALGHNFEVTNETEADYNHPGRIDYTCTRCGETRFETSSQLYHTYDTEWSVDEEKGTHYHACLDEGFTDLRQYEEAHNYDYEYVSESATEASPAEKTRRCRTCGYEEAYEYYPSGEYYKSVQYNLSEDKTHYIAQYADSNAVDIVIASSYAGLPVTEINGSFAAFNKNKMKTVVIPGSIKSITDYALSYIESLKEVIVEEGVEELCDCVFDGCHSLETISLPNTLKSIGAACFRQCYHLTSITIPSSVESISGTNTFLYCERLREVINKSQLDINIESGSGSFGYLTYNAYQVINNEKDSKTGVIDDDFVVYINNEEVILIDYRGSDYTVYIPDSVTTVSSKCFYKLNIATVFIPNGVKKIEGSAFADSQLACLVISETVTSIGTNHASKLCEVVNHSSTPHNFSSAQEIKLLESENDITVNVTDDGFVYYTADNGEVVLLTYCGSNAEITIPDFIDVIGASCFSKNMTIKIVNVPGNVKRIERFAFESSGAYTVNLAEGVERIEERAFFTANYLTYINFPSTLTFIGNSAFFFCGGPQTIYKVPGTVREFGPYAFARYYTNGYIYYTGSVEERLTTEGVRFVGELQWIDENDQPITTVDIPNTITSIPDCAFYGCDKITSITIPETVTSIGQGVFYGCTSLTELNLENNPNYKIVDGILYDQQMERVLWCSPDVTGDIVLPSSVRTIDAGAFAGRSSITSITLSSVTSIGENAFEDCDSLACVNYHGSLDEWLQLLGKEYLKGDIHLFLNGDDTETTDIVIPDGNTVIYDYAFTNCVSIVSIFIPNGITGIGAYAFENCSSLKTVVVCVENNTMIIYDYAFNKCDALEASFKVGNNSISVYGYNDAFINAIAYYSEEEPTDNNKRYYHYVDGVPTLWPQQNND